MRASSALPADTVKKRTGSAAPPFAFTMNVFDASVALTLVMMTVRLATAVRAMGGDHARCLVGACGDRTRTILRRRMHGGSLLHGDKERRYGRQQEDSNEWLQQ